MYFPPVLPLQLLFWGLEASSARGCIFTSAVNSPWWSCLEFTVLTFPPMYWFVGLDPLVLFDSLITFVCGWIGNLWTYSPGYSLGTATVLWEISSWQLVPWPREGAGMLSFGMVMSEAGGCVPLHRTSGPAHTALTLFALEGEYSLYECS